VLAEGGCVRYVIDGILIVLALIIIVKLNHINDRRSNSRPGKR
jgi:hypothetical protein